MVRRGVVAALAALSLLGTAGSACDEATAPAAPPGGQPTQGGAGHSPDPVAFLDGVPMPTPTGLRLLLSGWLLDIDADRRDPTIVTGWLRNPGRAPVLLEEVRTAADSGVLQVSSVSSPQFPGARVIRVAGPMLNSIAPSADGAGLWIEEYVAPDRCRLREVAADGRDRRPAREVTCGTRPVAETPHGLWVTVGPDARAAATTVTTAAQTQAVLLDPRTLAERARHSRVELIDQERYLEIPLAGELYELHDLRNGDSTPIPRPQSHGRPDPLVGELSQDGRYLPFTFGEPSSVPQAIDIWLWDLHTGAWLHPPRMPAYAALKGTSLTWAPDGRLVILGQFADSPRSYGKPLVVTWRPGDTVLHTMPYQRPESSDTRILAL